VITVPELVEVKLRPVGNALGLILPSKLVKNEHLKSGETVKIALLKKRKIDLSKLFGIARGAPPFEREHGHRD